MRKVKWGVLGVAKIAMEKVIPAMQRGEVSRDRRDRFARSRQGARGCRSGSASSAPTAPMRICSPTPTIEAVYNPLPNELHVPWTLRALEAGKHVLCEKPIALDANEARQLIEARERSGRLVAEAFMVRYHPQWRRARELVAGGRDRRGERDPDVLLLSPARSRQRAQPAAGRRRALRHRLLRDPDRALHFRRRADAASSRPSTAIRIFGTDRLVSAIVEFPGGRHLTFSVATQLSAHQRVTIVGDGGADRDRHSVQRAARPADEDHDRRRRGSVRRRGAGRGIPGLRSVHACRATRSRAPCSGKRRSSFRSRTPSPTCASSTRCSARRNADRGRRRRRARQQHRREDDRAAQPSAARSSPRQARPRRTGPRTAAAPG